MQDLHIDTRVISGETAPHSAELYVFMSHLKSALNEFHSHFFSIDNICKKKNCTLNWLIKVNILITLLKTFMEKESRRIVQVCRFSV